MARSFNGTNQSMQQSGINLSGTSLLCISFWLWWNAFANNDALAMEYTPNFNTTPGGILIDPNNSTPNPGTFSVGISGGGETVATFTRPTAAAWHQYVLNFNHSIAGSGSIPSVYVDGGSQSLSFPTALNGNQNFANSTFNFMSRNAASLFGAGRMADIAVWGGINLTALEASGLSQGIRPVKIRPASLLAYWPLDGLVSPEPDVSGNAHNMALNNAPSQIFGPPLSPLSLLATM